MKGVVPTPQQDSRVLDPAVRVEKPGPDGTHSRKRSLSHHRSQPAPLDDLRGRMYAPAERRIPVFRASARPWFRVWITVVFGRR
jgi:hypothetical protein